MDLSPKFKDKVPHIRSVDLLLLSSCVSPFKIALSQNLQYLRQRYGKI